MRKFKHARGYAQADEQANAQAKTRRRLADEVGGKAAWGEALTTVGRSISTKEQQEVKAHVRSVPNMWWSKRPSLHKLWTVVSF